MEHFKHQGKQCIHHLIHDYCPAWVLADPDGIIVDTNLLRDPSAGGDEGSGSDDPGGDPGGDPSGEDPSDLENKDDGNYPSTEGKIPDHHPLRISVSHDERLEFDSPRVDLDKKLAESVHISTNMNPSLVSFKFRSYCNWLLCVDKAIIVNGNPSVLPRSASLYLDVYYGTWRFKTIAIPVRQPGVQATIVTPSNVSSFELLNGINPGGYTVAFTPYAGSESFEIAHNGDEICDPLSSYANPTLLSGELFRTDQSLPEVNRVEKQEGEYSYTITYDSNRHTRLFKGCILRFIPVIIVIQDWNDIENSYAFYSVDDGTGFAYYLPVYALQTPVVLLTEYDSYLSEAIAEPLADPAGYNRLKAYSDIERRTVASDEIRVYSNVSWRLRDVSLENEFWQYTIKNGDLTVLADGKTIEEMGMNVYVNDYLKTKVDGKYRPNQSYPSRWTQLRVEVDLKDGLGATTVPLADIGQVGIPYTRFVNGVGTSCKEGEYPFNGHTYQFAVSYTVYLETESDHLTDIFTRNPSIHFQSSTGDCTISNWSEISKWATSISNTLYVDTDTDVSVTCDWKVPLSNYVEVYSQSSPVLNWELETHVVNRVESQVSERLYEGSRYNGKPLVNLSLLLGTTPVLNGPRNGPVKNEWHVCPSLPPLETGRWQNAGLARK